MTKLVFSFKFIISALSVGRESNELFNLFKLFLEILLFLSFSLLKTDLRGEPTIFGEPN